MVSIIGSERGKYIISTDNFRASAVLLPTAREYPYRACPNLPIFTAVMSEKKPNPIAAPGKPGPGARPGGPGGKPKGPGLFSLMKPYRGLVYTLVGLTIISSAIGLVVPRITAHGIDGFFHH